MYDVAIDAQGRYLVTGRTSSYDLQMRRPADQGDGFDLVLLRLNSDGSLDTTFGDRGKVIFAGAEDDQALRVDTRPDGRIVLLGQSSSFSGPFGLPGEPDLFRQAIILEFADSGEVLHFYSLGLEGEDKPSSFVVDPAGRVVLTGFRLPAVDYEYESEGPEVAQRRLWVHAFQLR